MHKTIHLSEVHFLLTLESGTFNCSRKRCNTCSFINSKTHIQGPKGSYQVNDHFDCTTSNIIYCITCTLCNKLYIGESGRKLGDGFREHLLDVKNKGSDLSKPVARHFNLPGHSCEHMEICRINLHFGNNETRLKGKNRDSFSNSGPWLPTESMNDFHSANFKHILDQLDATNFNQWQNLTFRSA